MVFGDQKNSNTQLNGRKRNSFVFALSLLVGAAVLAFDLYAPFNTASAVPYVALVLIGLIQCQPAGVLLLALAGTLLTAAGFYLSGQPPILHVELINRGLALFAIWVTALVSYRHLKTLAELQPLAMTDQLTGLYNRHHFTSAGTKLLQLWQRHKTSFCLILFDVDDFKRVNDHYGHPAGDYALQSIADISLHLVREIDTVARIGGEEFAILLPATDLAGALQTAERLRRHVEVCTFQFEETRFNLTISLGVAELDASLSGMPALIKAADQALYRAKAAGRNCTLAAVGT